MAAEPAFQSPPPPGGISDSISELVEDVQRLVELEIELAQQEIKALVRRNLIAVGLIAAGLLGALFFLIFAQVTLVEAVPLPRWLNALILTVLWLVATVILVYVGYKRIKIAPPEKTIQSIKDDIEWVKTQIRLVTR